MNNPHIVACASQLPSHYYSQEDLLAGLETLWQASHYNQNRLRQFHQAMNIQGRFLSLPREQYLTASDFSERNRHFQRVSLELGELVVQKALEQARVKADQIDFLVYTTVTGLAVPSLDAQLMNRLPFRRDLKRLPLFGLGCLGGAAGVARLNDLLRGSPESLGLLLSVELCSLTLQSQDLSVANLVATGLFGDGAAAVVMSSHKSAKSGPKVLATRSVFFPDSQGVMGWEIGSQGFSIVLSPQVPHYARHHLAPALQEFLADQQLDLPDVAAWIAHPGGPKVVEALEETFGLPPQALAVTKKSLQEVGNLSSASVLLILEETLKKEIPAGSYAIMLSMGPAFCAELVLLQW